MRNAPVAAAVARGAEHRRRERHVPQPWRPDDHAQRAGRRGEPQGRSGTTAAWAAMPRAMAPNTAGAPASRALP